MRHILLPGAITAGARRMLEATSMARLVALAGGALRAATTLLGAFLSTVDLATVATGADQHLSPAAGAKK
jgi:hypothetical protein